MNYKIIEKEAFYVLEKVEKHSLENGANLKSVPDFWTRANADGTTDFLLSQAKDKTYVFGVCYGEIAEDKTFDYSIGVCCAEDASVPEGYRVTKIPARTWAVFECYGAMPNAIQETWKKIYTEFFPNSEYVTTKEFDIEAYPDGDTDSPDYYCEIWLPVVKK